jgi:hypothetical protein
MPREGTPPRLAVAVTPMGKGVVSAARRRACIGCGRSGHSAQRNSRWQAFTSLLVVSHQRLDGRCAGVGSHLRSGDLHNRMSLSSGHTLGEQFNFTFIHLRFMNSVRNWRSIANSDWSTHSPDCVDAPRSIRIVRKMLLSTVRATCRAMQFNPQSSLRICVHASWMAQPCDSCRELNNEDGMPVSADSGWAKAQGTPKGSVPLLHPPPSPSATQETPTAPLHQHHDEPSPGPERPGHMCGLQSIQRPLISAGRQL